MAKGSAIARRFGAPKMRWRTRIVPAARRAVSAGARAAAAEKHTFTALAAAAAVGFAERQGVNLPSVGPLDGKATLGVIAWAAGRMTRNRTIQHAATGLLAIAVYDAARGSGGGTSGDDDISGDFDNE